MKRLILAVLSIIAIANNSFAATNEEVLPVPLWQEGSAVITGSILNYQKDGVKTAILYPRCSLGNYADRINGTVPVDSSGCFRIEVPLYQTHLPCFIDVPGYYGLMYISPGDSISLTVDQSKRRDNDFHGDDGSVMFSGGEDADINNMLATNFGHDATWDSFFNDKYMRKKYVSKEELKSSVMAHRDKRLRHVESHVSSPRLREFFRVNIDSDAVRDLLTAPYYRIVQQDSVYCTFLKEMDISNPIYRWASDFDGIVRNLSNLRLTDDTSKIKDFSDITGIRSAELIENLRAYQYSNLIFQGDTVPEVIFSNELKNLSAVPKTFLRDQNNYLKNVLAQQVNIGRLSPHDSTDTILNNLAVKHKGKLILVNIMDSWFTPVIKDQERYKKRYDDDVVFVYLASDSGPEAEWMKQIKTITGEHYRLTRHQIDALKQKFTFRGTPTYILIDRNGKIVHTGDVRHFTDLLDKYL